jgi:hypothetical protein
VQTLGALTGALILVHEALFTRLDRPSLLMIAGGLLGLPVAVQIQARRDQPPPSVPPPDSAPRDAPTEERR